MLVIRADQALKETKAKLVILAIRDYLGECFTNFEFFEDITIEIISFQSIILFLLVLVDMMVKQAIKVMMALLVDQV